MKSVNIIQSVTVMALGLVLALPVTAQADGKNRHDFTAQFTCGFNPHNTARLVSGEYRASIAARNRSKKSADVAAQIALTFPPPGTIVENIIELKKVTIMPGQAISFDCGTLMDSLGLPPPYVQGMLTISSRKKLEVSATQTAADLYTGHVSISVRKVYSARGFD